VQGLFAAVRTGVAGVVAPVEGLGEAVAVTVTFCAPL
jgi:hypothetical protein